MPHNFQLTVYFIELTSEKAHMKQWFNCRRSRGFIEFVNK